MFSKFLIEILNIDKLMNKNRSNKINGQKHVKEFLFQGFEFPLDLKTSYIKINFIILKSTNQTPPKDIRMIIIFINDDVLCDTNTR